MTLIQNKGEPSGGVCQSAQPSACGEIEITDLNRVYPDKGELQVTSLGRGVAGSDAGTHESLLQAVNFVKAAEDRQGLMISSPEEIACRKGFVDREQLKRVVEKLEKNSYSDYLFRLATKGLFDGKGNRI